jgi:hypothetical protein
MVKRKIMAVGACGGFGSSLHDRQKLEGQKETQDKIKVPKNIP